MPLFKVERTDEPYYSYECVELLIRADSAEQAQEIACMATSRVVSPRDGGDDRIEWDHDYEGMRLVNTKVTPFDADGPAEVLAVETNG